MDAVNELIIVLGIGLSGMVHLSLALLILALYLMLTINVSINAHLKKEFRLTYARMGPTELRIIMIIVNTVLVLIPSIRTFSHTFMLWGHELTIRTMDYVAAFIFLALLLIYLTEIVKDAKEYARLDPPKR